MAGIAVENAVFGGSKRFSAQVIAWCTYTAPEVAHVGLYERDIAARGLESDTYSVQLKHNDRAICEGAADDGGFVKIHCKKGTDEILGATICSEHAGESISELTVAIQSHIGLGALGRTIHPYPTVAEAIQGCGIGYNRTQSGPGVELPSRISRRRRDCLLDGWNSVARAGGRRWKTTAARSSRSSWAR